MPEVTVAAICAVCEQPITKAQRFVLSATEVIHRSCASTGGKTVLWRTREDRAKALEVAERAARVTEALQRELAYAQREARESRRVCTDLERDLKLARDSSQLSNTMGRTLAGMAAQRDKAIGERDVAVRQLASVDPPTSPGSPASSDPVDDAAARFALLELT
jgi:hypothetical protein